MNCNPTGQCADTLAAQFRRRRLAAARSVPLACCGCRDPILCRCHDDPLSDLHDRSELMLWAARAASEHLAALGLPPVFDPETTRALELCRLPVWLREWAEPVWLRAWAA
jgi:hypothetical protein